MQIEHKTEKGTVLEIWKDIEGHNGDYQISNLGRVKSFFRTDYIKPSITHRGYYSVCLRNKEGKKMNYVLHRLVAIAFIPNTENKPEVNHKDTNKLNNDYSNLEWMTKRENINHFYNNTNKFKSRDGILRIDLISGKIIKKYEAVQDVVLDGFNRSGVSQVLSGKNKSSGGFGWEYNEVVLIQTRNINCVV